MSYADLIGCARRASTLLKAMSNERRLLILCHLAEGERSVGELESPQSIIYSLEGEEALTIMEALRRLYVSEAAATRGKDVAGAAD